MGLDLAVVALMAVLAAICQPRSPRHSASGLSSPMCHTCVVGGPAPWAYRSAGDRFRRRPISVTQMGHGPGAFSRSKMSCGATGGRLAWVYMNSGWLRARLLAGVLAGETVLFASTLIHPYFMALGCSGPRPAVSPSGPPCSSESRTDGVGAWGCPSTSLGGDTAAGGVLSFRARGIRRCAMSDKAGPGQGFEIVDRQRAVPGAGEAPEEPSDEASGEATNRTTSGRRCRQGLGAGPQQRQSVLHGPHPSGPTRLGAHRLFSARTGKIHADSRWRVGPTRLRSSPTSCVHGAAEVSRDMGRPLT